MAKRLNRIAEVLKKSGKSQLWLSNETELTYRSISLYVNGKREPSLESLFKIAKALNVRAGDLINE